jgi:restriction system protein
MWQREIRHEGLHKFRVVKGETPAIMQLRAQMQLRVWDEQWERVQATQKKRQAQVKAAHDKDEKKQLAAERTREAQKTLDALTHLLRDVLEEDHEINWSLLIDNSEYAPEKPTQPTDEPMPREPHASDQEFRAQLGILKRIIPSLREKETARVATKLSEAKKKWTADMAARCRRIEKANERFEKDMAAWDANKKKWLEERDQRNAAFDAWKKAYLAGSQEAIPDYCKLIFGGSTYPDSFPADAAVDYIADSRTIVVDYCAYPTFQIYQPLRKSSSLHGNHG